MFEFTTSSPISISSETAAAHITTHPNSSKRGPIAFEERSNKSPMQSWLTLMLDEIDYGMVLLSEAGHVVHLNHTARNELDDNPLLQIAGHALQARRPQDVEPLRAALQEAVIRRRRRLVTLGTGKETMTVALVPLGDNLAQSATLAVLSKSRVCEDLTMQCFASNYGLTLAESQVLKALCAGLTPQNVAKQNGVAISTVRTQIHSIRGKTGSESISGLVRQLGLLPPLIGALRRSMQ